MDYRDGVPGRHPLPTSNKNGNHFPLAKRGNGGVQAKYDAANLADSVNYKHWIQARLEAADLAGSPQIRLRLRNRSRYEYANNSYFLGIVNTLANDLIGVCPRLQLQSGNPAADRYVEREIASWLEAAGIPDKLRLMRKAKAVDGESFAMYGTNPLQCHEVQLDLIVIEGDQISTPGLYIPRPGHVDGIVFDEFRNPIEYHLLKYHPGEPYAMFLFKYDRIPARDMIHIYRIDRPGQIRGIPELTPALNLFAQLRRFTSATLGSAELAAQINLVLETDLPAYQNTDFGNPYANQTDFEPFDVVPFQRDAMVTLPAGMKISQVDPKHPTSNYDNFKTNILTEIARCLNVPKNIALGDSSGYNYSSGRLDHRLYFKSVEIERDLFKTKVLNPLIRRWFEEARLIPGYLPEEYMSEGSQYQIHWMFDAPVSIDPTKDVAANDIALKNGTMTYSQIYANKGEDYETAFRQRAREEALLKELGLQFDNINGLSNNNPAASQDVNNQYPQGGVPPYGAVNPPDPVTQPDPVDEPPLNDGTVPDSFPEDEDEDEISDPDF